MKQKQKAALKQILTKKKKKIYPCLFEKVPKGTWLRQKYIKQSLKRRASRMHAWDRIKLRNPALCCRVKAF